MVDQGLLERSRTGDLRDLVARRYEDGNVVSAAPDDTLQTVFNRMRAADLSQLPVIENGRVVGLIDESDLLLRVQADRAHFKASASSAMTRALEFLRPDAGVEALRGVLDRGLVAIIADDARFYGLVTRIDLLNHLRRNFA
jgi:cystathionine beta-synthase